MVKLKSILDVLKVDYNDLKLIIEYLESICMVKKDDLKMKLLPMNNKVLLFIKIDKFKYLIFDVNNLDIYKTDRARLVFNEQLFRLFFNENMTNEEFNTKFETIDAPLYIVRNILKIIKNNDALFNNQEFELEINDNLKIVVSIINGLVYFYNFDKVEITNFDLIFDNDIVDNYDIDINLIPSYIKNKKEEFNNCYEKKYGYKIK